MAASSAAVAAARAAPDATANDAASAPANDAMVSGEKGAPKVPSAMRGRPVTAAGPIDAKAKAVPRVPKPGSQRRKALRQAPK